MSKLSEAKSRIVEAVRLLSAAHGVPQNMAIQIQQGDIYEQQAQHAEAVAEFLEGLFLESVKKGLYDKFLGISSLHFLRSFSEEELIEHFGVSKTDASKLLKALAIEPVLVEVSDPPDFDEAEFLADAQA